VGRRERIGIAGVLLKLTMNSRCHAIRSVVVLVFPPPRLSPCISRSCTHTHTHTHTHPTYTHTHSHPLTQTDATMTELEIDMNMRIGEWSIIQESGKELTPCYGPGYTGLSNLGNRYGEIGGNARRN